MTDTPTSDAGTPEQQGNDRDRLTRLLAMLAKALGVAVTFVTLTGGAVTLLFQIAPTLEPCIGGSGVQFTSAAVLPNYRYDTYWRDLHGPDVPAYIKSLNGVELRYSYKTENLSGHGLVFRGTLQQIAPNGDLRPPGLPSFEYQVDDDLVAQGDLERMRLKAAPLNETPDKCSDDASGIFWIQLPPELPRHRRYRILMELYRGTTLDERVGVKESPVFEH
jgi:hypothetical protein